MNIRIIDLNDNAPTFDNAPISVKESHTVGQQIKQLVGSDADSGKNGEFDFSLLTSNTPFTVSSNGKLSIKSALDREVKDSYVLSVRITERGTKPSPLSTQKNINIKILDVNDNKPSFSTNPINCQIPENPPANTFVCRTTATDKDIGENARLTYSITGDSNFKINSVS